MSLYVNAFSSREATLLQRRATKFILKSDDDYLVNIWLGFVNSCGRRGGLMVSALDSGASAPGSSPGRGHCVVFLGKTLYSHSASLHPGVQMGTSELLGKT